MPSIAKSKRGSHIDPDVSISSILQTNPNSQEKYSIDIEENDISDIRYAIDDAYNDVFMEVDTDLFEDESRIADIEETIKEENKYHPLPTPN